MTDQNDRNVRLLFSRAVDAVRFARDRQVCRFIGFLSESEAAVCAQALAGEGWSRYAFWGGHDEAERVMLGVLDEYTQAEDAQWPFDALTVDFRKGAELSHRSFLGSLMSLGIERDKVGDILIGDSYAVVFVSDSVSGYICGELTKVGGEGVRVTLGCTRELPQMHGFEPLRLTVASARLDCVVAALARTSRGEAARLIESGLVTVDSLECDKVSHTVAAGSKVAVRGKGKFAVDSLDGLTRKGRVILEARRYI